jgi:hypothetical protein
VPSALSHFQVGIVEIVVEPQHAGVLPSLILVRLDCRTVIDEIDDRHFLRQRRHGAEVVQMEVGHQQSRVTRFHVDEINLKFVGRRQRET